MNESSTDPLFDEYAEGYDTALNQGLMLSGEGKDFFAKARIVWLHRILRAHGMADPTSLLDFGCGIGSATPYFHEEFSLKRLAGVDVSVQSILRARATHQDARTHFESLAESTLAQEIDLAFCSGVFHHIPVAERAEAIQWVFNALRPGGLFAFWENNPWNLGARAVMRRIPFDRDAILIWPTAARRLLRAAGFELLSTTSQFFFPAFLKRLRPLETLLGRTTLGAQYLILCRKPME